MRVAIVTDYPADPRRPRGGVEAVSANLVRALAMYDDLEIHVVTADRSCREPSRITADGVSVHRLPRQGRFTLTDAIGIGRRRVSGYLRALAPDLVHAHDTYGLMVKGLPIPRVLTIHGFIYGDTRVSGGRLARLRARLWRQVETSSWAEHPHIVSISPYVRERLSGIATGVIHDIENPIAESFFSVERQERAGTVFSAALIEPRKNTLGLVDAFARLRRAGLECELRLAGRVTDPAYGRRVEARIRRAGLEDSVHLLGGLTRDEVAFELGRASVFALVSLEENAPLGIAEAMAVGVPVLASNRCGMPYMVRHGETGFLVDPHDAVDVARRLERVLADERLRKSMSEVARREARERFHPEVVAHRTRDLYRDIVTGSGRS
jgi:glycosyltransferase involved in cell wall biosynthesis